MNRPPIELGYTRLKSLLCPYYYKRIYVDGIEEPDGEAARAGTVLHFGAARYGQRLLETHRYTDHDWAQKFFPALIAKEPPHMQEQMLETANNFIASFSLDRSAESHHFELRLAVTWPGLIPCSATDNVDKVAGTLDLAAVYSRGAQVDITDYKMGFRLIDFDEVHKDPQLPIYLWLWMMTHPECLTGDITMWGPKWGGRNKSEDSMDRDTVRAKVEPLIAAGFEVVEAHYAKYGNEPWPTNPDWSVCRWCQLACPEYALNLKKYEEAA